MATIYIVTATQGDYDLKIEQNVCAFLSKDKAIKLMEQLEKCVQEHVQHFEAARLNDPIAFLAAILAYYDALRAIHPNAYVESQRDSDLYWSEKNNAPNYDFNDLQYPEMVYYKIQQVELRD